MTIKLTLKQTLIIGNKIVTDQVYMRMQKHVAFVLHCKSGKRGGLKISKRNVLDMSRNKSCPFRMVIVYNTQQSPIKCDTVQFYTALGQ